MSTFTKVLLTTALFFLSCEHVLAKEWRGIIPLRSTRSDVIRGRHVCIHFSGGLGDEFGECRKRLPRIGASPSVYLGTFLHTSRIFDSSNV